MTKELLKKAFFSIYIDMYQRNYIKYVYLFNNYFKIIFKNCEFSKMPCCKFWIYIHPVNSNLQHDRNIAYVPYVGKPSSLHPLLHINHLLILLYVILR